MRSAQGQWVLFIALAASQVAASAIAKPRVEAPVAQAPQRLNYVAAPRRTDAPELVLRPEFSEGEWPEHAIGGRLDPTALQDASAPVDTDIGRATSARAGSNLAKIGDRQTQGAPVPTSRLDQPMDRMPGPIVTFGGFDFGSVNFRRPD